MTPDTDRALDNALECWREWMETGREALGYPATASGFHGWRSSEDFDTLAREADIALARSVDAALGDLEPAHRMALCTAMLRSRWTGRPVEYAAALSMARAALAERLARRGVLD